MFDLFKASFGKVILVEALRLQPQKAREVLLQETHVRGCSATSKLKTH